MQLRHKVLESRIASQTLSGVSFVARGILSQASVASDVAVGADEVGLGFDFLSCLVLGLNRLSVDSRFHIALRLTS